MKIPFVILDILRLSKLKLQCLHPHVNITELENEQLTIVIFCILISLSTWSISNKKIKLSFMIAPFITTVLRFTSEFNALIRGKPYP